MKHEFNFESYKAWFNDNYNEYGYYLDEGPHPEDGDSGMYEMGYEIDISIYPEGMDIGSHEACIIYPEAGHKHDPNFVPEFDLDPEEFADFNLDEKDFRIVDKTLIGVDTKVLVLPYLMRYFDVYEGCAIDYTGVAPKKRLKDYLERG